MMDIFKRPVSRYTCFKVRNDIIAVQVSTRKYRLAQMTNDGNGFMNLGNKPMTNIREFEFVSDPLSRQEMLKAIEAYATEETVVDV